jgi:hypothetical protein
MSSGYFLSAVNPVANIDQRHLEDLATRVFQRPELLEARQRALGLWIVVTDHDAPAEARALAKEAIDEYCFNFTLKAANSDASHPRVLRLFVQAHEWLGRKVPGARIGGDNPDNCYRLVPVEDGAAYEIRGKVFGMPASDVTWTLVANNSTSKTLASLEQRDVVVEPDGSFIIRVDSRPAEGRANHLRSRPGVKWLFIRDSMGDWANQMPYGLQVSRLAPPAAVPLSEDEIARRAAEFIIDEVPLTFWFTRLNFGLPPNTLSMPHSSGKVGGLQSQWASYGRIVLQDDEAFIVNAKDPGASYRHFVVNDWWYRSIDPWHCQSSLNNEGMVADADGSYTYVVALQDPGVANWIDTGGLHQVYAIQKWQGLPREIAPGDEPRLSWKKVKLSELKQALPPGTKWVDAPQRQQALRERAAAFARRLIDC